MKEASSSAAHSIALDRAPIGLDSKSFYNQIIRKLSGALQDIVGLAEAEGFMTLVASRIGDRINADYKNILKLDQLPKDLISSVLVDLKHRIEGNFTVEYEDDKVIILRNSRCPFGDNVKDRPALCMMTTNVFGRIAADSNGYSRVIIDRALSRGDPDCRVVIHLSQETSDRSSGKEFYRAVS